MSASLAQPSIADGVARGEITVDTPATAARAVFDATSRFHKPAHAAEWTQPEIDKAFEGVVALVLRGLAATPRVTDAPRSSGRGRRRSEQEASTTCVKVERLVRKTDTRSCRPS